MRSEGSIESCHMTTLTPEQMKQDLKVKRSQLRLATSESA